jgi:hypothetical protein
MDTPSTPSSNTPRSMATICSVDGHASLKHTSEYARCARGHPRGLVDVGPEQLDVLDEGAPQPCRMSACRAPRGSATARRPACCCVAGGGCMPSSRNDVCRRSTLLSRTPTTTWSPTLAVARVAHAPVHGRSCEQSGSFFGASG